MLPSPFEISLITAMTALVASVMGPLVTLAVARRQFRANVISTNRQKWIETFRDRVSELLSLMSAAQLVKRHTAESWRGGVGPAASMGVTDRFEKAFMALSEIRLLTNAGDPAHQRLNDALAEALEHVQHDELRDQELDECVEVITSIGRTIIRQEWARVKRGV